MASDKTATERLRELLDERGVEWRRTPHYSHESTDTETVFPGEGIEWIAGDHLNGRVGLHALRYEVTPEQAVEATLGDSVAAGERQDAAKVYLVEVSDELIESWYPLGVYLNKESAEDCAEAYRREEDGVLQFARVSELKVVDE